MLLTLTETLQRLGMAALLTLALLVCQQLSVATSNHSLTVEEEATPVAVNRLN
jgi:hypothetical protein